MNACKVLLLAGLIVLSGCATPSTIESRRHERADVYQRLSPEQMAAVDSGKIKVGMTKDAVYIALGKPQQILQRETSQGATEIWLYMGQSYREVRYWSYHHYYAGPYLHASPFLSYDYYPLRYVRTEVIFEGNTVKEWRTLPQPQG